MNVILLTCVSGKLFQRAIGAYQLAHSLREHGYTVQVIDFTDDFQTGELLEAVEAFITEDTLALGISTTFYGGLEGRFISADKTFDAVIPPNVEQVARQVRSRYPTVRVVIGGSRSAIGEKLDYADHVIHGYAEDEMLSYVRQLAGTACTYTFGKDATGKWRSTSTAPPKFNIEKLAHRFTVQDHVLPGEVLPLEISRGCIFKCKFCAFPLNGKKKLDYLRDPKLIRDELVWNHEQYGTTSYFINDDTFNDSTQKLEALHREITALPFKIRFTCYLRPDLLYAHPEQIQLVRELGLASPFFGIESLNQRSATAVGKGMNTHKLRDFLLELHDVHWRGEIPITCSYIVGLPFETRESLGETFTWARSTPLSSLFFPLTLDVKSHYVSEFQRDHRKYGYEVTETGWRSSEFTYSEAAKLAEKFNSELLYSSDRPSSWFLLTLLNHGLTLEAARKLRVRDLDWKQLLREKKRKIESYKSLLKEATCSLPRS